MGNAYFWRMKIFRCQKCENPLYFENTKCEVCGCILGYCEKNATLTTLVGSSDVGVNKNSNDVYALLKDDGKRYRYCKNVMHKACNWILSEDDEGEFCTACALNQTIPNLQKRKNLREWRKLERAKHRLVYALLRFGLPVIDKDAAPKKRTGLRFSFG